MSLKNEIDIMKKLKHENIVGLFDVRKSSNNIYLFLELCKESLEQKLKKNVRFS
jgi:serine/threonine protein kinase